MQLILYVDDSIKTFNIKLVTKLFGAVQRSVTTLLDWMQCWIIDVSYCYDLRLYSFIGKRIQMASKNILQKAGVRHQSTPIRHKIDRNHVAMSRGNKGYFGLQDMHDIENTIVASPSM